MILFPNRRVLKLSKDFSLIEKFMVLRFMLLEKRTLQIGLKMGQKSRVLQISSVIRIHRLCVIISSLMRKICVCVLFHLQRQIY